MNRGRMNRLSRGEMGGGSGPEGESVSEDGLQYIIISFLGRKEPHRNFFVYMHIFYEKQQNKPKRTWCIEAIRIILIRNIWCKYVNPSVICCTEVIRFLSGNYNFFLYVTISLKDRQKEITVSVYETTKLAFYSCVQTHIPTYTWNTIYIISLNRPV